MRWQLRSSDAKAAQNIVIALRSSAALNAASPRPLSPPQIETLAGLLLHRGIADPESAERFLSPSLEHLHSPYLMLNMQAAVDRLDAAIERREGILVYGDYDVDGTTAIVILKTAIELCGGAADFHVPHRIREGYDLRDDVIERAAAAGIRLIISVDMGIRAFAPAATARALGIDLIVTDHHLPGPDGVPDAFAVLNPNQRGCSYPCKSLCGAGVAFKFSQALLQRRLPHKDQTRLLTSFTKVAAIATIADSVPLVGENRVFAKLGLDALRSAVNPGLKALLEVAKLSGRPLTSQEVAFRIAPRINAAGRMDVARDVIDLFSTKEVAEAVKIAARLDQLNTERQEEERRILQSIYARFDDDPTLSQSFCIVLDGEGWHRGVIGITATRVVERYGRPALVIASHGEEAHGSGRSIPAFHLLNALESCAPLFTRFGGHAHAVGFSIASARVPELRAHLDAYARSRLTLPDFEPVLNCDAELGFEQLSPEFYALLERMEPFGVGNPEPVFITRNVQLATPHRILKDKHIKLRLAQNRTQADELSDQARQAMPRCHPESSSIPRRHSTPLPIIYNALGWNLAERFQQSRVLPGDRMQIAYTLCRNDHPEYGGLELTLKDFQYANSAAAPS